MIIDVALDAAAFHRFGVQKCRAVWHWQGLRPAEAVDDLGQWFHCIPLEKNSAEEQPEISRGKSIDSFWMGPLVHYPKMAVNE